MILLTGGVCMVGGGVGMCVFGGVHGFSGGCVIFWGDMPGFFGGVPGFSGGCVIFGGHA